MTDSKPRQWCCATVLALLAMFSHAAGQDAAAPEPVSAIVPPTLPTVAELTAQRQEAAQEGSLDESTHAAIDQQFAKAIENVQSAEQAERRTAALVKELQEAPQRVEQLQERLGTPLATGALPIPAEGESLDALSVRLKEAETAAATARQRLQEFTAEIDRRSVRRPQLADLRLQAEQQLQDVAQQLVLPAPEGEHAQVNLVRTIRLQTRQNALRKEVALLDQESRTYEGTARYLSLERDLAERSLREADRVVQHWQQQTADARRRQAEQEAMDARRASAQSHESVRKEAERNSELADANAGLVEVRQQTQLKLDRLDSDLTQRAVAFESLKKRSEAAEFSPAIGVLLRNQRLTLPDRDDIRLRIQQWQTDIATLNLNLMEWEAERKPLIDLATAATDIVSRLDSTSIPVSDLREQVHIILAARLKTLGDLVDNGKTQLDQLVRLDSLEQRLLKSVDDESHWLAEHVLWVRSTGIIGTHPRSFVSSATTLLNRQGWQTVGRVIAEDFTQNPWWGCLPAVLLLTLLISRRRVKQRIRDLGEIAERSSCTEFVPTLRTMFLTVLLAAPFPLLSWSIGMRLSGISRGENTLQALGMALQLAAGIWGVIEFVRQVGQPHGLGGAHFNWSETSMTVVRRTMRFLSLALLPLVLTVGYTELLGDDVMVSSIGRLAYLGAMAFAGWAAFRLLRPSSPILKALENEHAHEMLWRTRWLWTGFLLASPIVLSVLSVAGYHYTAVQLTGRVAATIGSALVALFVTAVLSRWLLLTYRKLAIRRGRERRQQMLQAAQLDPDQPIPADATPELKLVDINTQARRLLHMAAGVGTVIAMYLIWIDVLPALGILRKLELWQNNLVAVSEDAPVVWVTAADILIAAMIAGLTLVAARNVPGLMEIAVLQRLPLDAGARYAASTVSRYLIVVTGFIFGFRAIGIGWSSVQWLVAAMTVGLGFGLQEIFANFVSGIILLFERPVRVGDTVTIGEITGTVTRIQIRATTLLDWDNKELIVPNRDFVTGNLVNWTLTNPTLRLVAAVGVAYGSDTRLTTKLLYRVAAENSQVLDEPEPVVVFAEFGESSLNFELRLYVSGLASYRRLHHDLNLAIDDLFREHGIEIAFPQRDLHVRTLPPELLSRNRGIEAVGKSADDVPIEQVDPRESFPGLKHRR